MLLRRDRETLRSIRIGSQRHRVVLEARTWLRTPYINHGRVKGAGVDCAQLLLAVYDAVGLVPAPDVGRYAPDWHLHRSEEQYLGWVERYCVRVLEPRAGDVALFRFGRCVSHGGIISDGGWRDNRPPRMIHSYNGSGVLEEELIPQGALMPRLDSYWSLKRWAA